MSEEKMREEFELFASSKDHNIGWFNAGDAEYSNPQVDELWLFWQAACAHKDTEFAKECDAHKAWQQLHDKVLDRNDELLKEREQLRAEIEKYRMVATDNKDWFDQTKEEFDKRGALIAMQAEALKELVEAGNSEDDNAFYAANAKANRVISAASADCEAFMQAEIVKRLGEPFCFVHPIISEARKQAVPEGYIVVPIQLTADMSEAFDSCKRSDCEFADTFWEAMLSAAPQPDAAIRAKGN